MTIDNGFSFDGRHTLADMGLIYVPAGTRPLIAPRRVVSYTIAGMSGTRAYGDASVADVCTETGVLYSAGDLRSETEARALWRRVAAWLTVGRRQLIRDSEPDLYVIAEAMQLHMSEYGWLDGGLQVTWQWQPYHWQRTQTMLAGAELTAAVPTMARWVTMDTGRPAPVTVQVAVTGADALTGLDVTVGSKRATLTGLELAAGDALEISMEDPIGATITAADGSLSSALPCMVRLEELLIPAAGTGVSVTATFAGDGGVAQVRLMARGCWE